MQILSANVVYNLLADKNNTHYLHTTFQCITYNTKTNREITGRNYKNRNITLSESELCLSLYACS